MHCPDANCPGSLVIEQGSAVEPKTGRKFFLDYPCNLKKGEKVTFILSLHGFGSYGNWQRHYFPMMDYKDKYHLVIATPNSPKQFWAPADDEYLQNIVTLIYDQIGKQNIKAFWLVGHSQGGMTSNRIIRTDFFRERVDGWLSLSGGRLGENPGRGNFSNLTIGRGPTPAAAGNAGAGRAGAPNLAAAAAALRELPPASSLSFTRPAAMRWTAKASPRHPSGRKSWDAARAFKRRMSSIRSPDTSTIQRARTQVRTPGDGFRGRAPRRFSSIRTARAAE